MENEPLQLVIVGTYVRAGGDDVHLSGGFAWMFVVGLLVCCSLSLYNPHASIGAFYFLRRPCAMFFIPSIFVTSYIFGCIYGVFLRSCGGYG